MRVAALSFGGPAGQIAVMHRILVEEKRWISEERFLHALNYCMLLPGPEAQQLATYIGWLMHRTLGGIMAGGLFIAARHHLHHGAQLRLCGLGQRSDRRGAVLRPQGRGARDRHRGGGSDRQASLKNRVHDRARCGAFVGIFFFNVPFPIIVFGAAFIGFVGGRDGRDGISGRRRARPEQKGQRGRCR